VQIGVRGKADLRKAQALKQGRQRESDKATAALENPGLRPGLFFVSRRLQLNGHALRHQVRVRLNLLDLLFAQLTQRYDPRL
jgi:hypothetical protein